MLWHQSIRLSIWSTPYIISTDVSEHLTAIFQNWINRSLNFTSIIWFDPTAFQWLSWFASAGDLEETPYPTHKVRLYAIYNQTSNQWGWDGLWCPDFCGQKLSCTRRWLHACIHTYIHPYIHTYMLLISMLWHRQGIFESKGDKLSSSAESRIRTHQCLRHQIASRLNAHWQSDWAIEDQAKNLNSTARPYDQRAFSPLDRIAVWNSHLALAIYIFVVVNFDALAQASDIRIERRQVVFLCWEQDSNPSGSQTSYRQAGTLPILTLAIERVELLFY